MAHAHTCLHSLQQLRSCAWSLSGGFNGSCLRIYYPRALATAATSRQPAGVTVHSRCVTAGDSLTCSDVAPVFASLHLRPASRAFHVSSILCAAAKKSAEDLVKRISKDDVEMSFSRSGGAGGQNVNKVNTKAEVRLKIDEAEWLPDDMREALRAKYKNRINNEGEFVVTSQRTRTQGGNLEDAMDKLQSYIDNAALAVQPIEEDPLKKKKLEKQKKKANENRLQAKKLKSMKKGDRRNKGKGDW